MDAIRRKMFQLVFAYSMNSVLINDMFTLPTIALEYRMRPLMIILHQEVGIRDLIRLQRESVFMLKVGD